MSWAVEAQRVWHEQTAEEIAHAWVVGVVERTELGDLSGIALGWLGRQAPTLVSDLLAELNTPGPRGGLPPSAAACARALVRLREPHSAAAEVPRDLAVLQGLLSDAIGRNLGPDSDTELRDRTARLVELFGELQAEFTQALLDDRLESQDRDKLTGLPCEPAFQEELRRLAAASAEKSTPFSVLELDLDGLRHVNEAHGRSAGDRLLQRVAEIAREQLGRGHLYRRPGDELVALLPGSAGPTAMALATRLRRALEHLEQEGVTAPLSIGVASWPTDADDPADLLERVREATYLAKASGQGVALAEARLQRS